MSTPNLSVQTSNGGDLSKNFDGYITVWGYGIDEMNWASGCVLSTDGSARIKVQWQKRLNDYDDDGTKVPALRMGVVNDSGEKVSYKCFILADLGDSDASLSDLSDRAVNAES